MGQWPLHTGTSNKHKRAHCPKTSHPKQDKILKLRKKLQPSRPSCSSQKSGFTSNRAVAISGSAGTSPPAPIGHQPRRNSLLDDTRHGSGIETHGQAGNKLCNHFGKFVQILCKPNKRMQEVIISCNIAY